MGSLKEKVLLVSLLRRMQAHGSWCGETHIQKTVYFGRQLFDMPFEYEFILYKHGPFAFELRDELVSMHADGLLSQTIQPPPYGPSLIPGPAADALIARFPKTIGQHQGQLGFLATRVANRRAAELERIATALYVTRQLGGGAERVRVQAVTERKPHITAVEALEAVRFVDEMVAEAKTVP